MYLSAQGRGFSLRKQNQDPAVDSSSMDSVEACPEALSVVPSFKKQKTCDFQTTTNTSSANGVSELNILGMGHLKLIYIMK